MIKINGKSLKDYIEEQAKQGEVLENVCGTMTNKFCQSRTRISNSYGDHEGFLITDNAQVTIRRGDQRYTLRGDRIEKKNGQWYVDGEAVEWDTIGGEYKPENVVNIEIHGNVNSLRIQAGYIKVEGDVQNINTTSGDVTCGPVGGNVETVSGDITKR